MDSPGPFILVHFLLFKKPLTALLVCSVPVSALQVSVSQAPLLGAGAQSALALVGCFSFKAGTVLAAVTKAEQVGHRSWLEVCFGLRFVSRCTDNY